MRVLKGYKKVTVTFYPLQSASGRGEVEPRITRMFGAMQFRALRWQLAAVLSCWSEAPAWPLTRPQGGLPSYSSKMN